MTQLVLSIFVLSADIAKADDGALDALRATVRVADSSTSGTGFFVALDQKTDPHRRHVLVTAAHVLHEFSGEKCNVVFRAPGEKGTYGRKEVSLNVRDGKKKLWQTLPEIDVAVIPMDLPAGVDIRPFEYRQIAEVKYAESGKVHVGQDVCVPCFPAKVEANPAGWPILRKGSIATHPLVPLASAKTMFIDYSHFGGDSGAPVVAWIDNEPIVVGLVIAMERQTDKTTMPFEERTVHTPLNLAIALQSPLVRQVIDAWEKKRDLH
jgi:hypothetical protein